jgi:nucleoside-diphosphate-sugar epimerase
MSRKRILVLGGGGFIGNHLVTALVAANHWVRAIDLSGPSFSHSQADDFVYADLRINPPLISR